MYSLGWEDMGVVVELEEWTLVVVGLADNAGVALVEDDGVKVILPDGGDVGVALADGVNIVKEVPE